MQYLQKKNKKQHFYSEAKGASKATLTNNFIKNFFNYEQPLNKIKLNEIKGIPYQNSKSGKRES